MEDKELIELYKQRNEFAKAGNINQTENITNLINEELPTKISKRGFRDSNGKIVQFEIVGITENADYLKSLYINGCQKYDRPYINGKRIYSRILIKRR